MDELQIRARLLELIDAMSIDQQKDLLKLLEWGRNNRRQHGRKTCTRPATISTPKDRLNGMVRNISEGGLFIETPPNVSVGQDVSLSISLFSFEEPVHINGKVVRIEPLGVAVKFDSILKKF